MGDDSVLRDAVSCRVVTLFDEQRTRDGEVVETGDVPEVEGQVYGRLVIGSVEGAALVGVAVGAHADAERGLDGGDRATDLARSCRRGCRQLR